MSKALSYPSPYKKTGDNWKREPQADITEKRLELARLGQEADSLLAEIKALTGARKKVGFWRRTG